MYQHRGWGPTIILWKGGRSNKSFVITHQYIHIERQQQTKKYSCSSSCKVKALTTTPPCDPVFCKFIIHLSDLLIWQWSAAKHSGTSRGRRPSWWSWWPACLCPPVPVDRVSAPQPGCPLSACTWSPLFSALNKNVQQKKHFYSVLALQEESFNFSHPLLQHTELTSAPSRQVA